MRVGLISDIHGNLPALEAVLADLERQQLDRVICLGDICFGPQVHECLGRVRRSRVPGDPRELGQLVSGRLSRR